MSKFKNIAFWKDFFKVIINYPSTFFKYISLENYHRLVHALKNEPPSLIIQNFKKLLQRTLNTTPENIYNRIDTFVENINLPKNKKSALFVSHDNSRTGAPLIILRIAEEFSKRHHIFPIFIICKDEGGLEEEFRQIGPTYDLVHWNESTLLKTELNNLIYKLNHGLNVDTAYVNSVESRKTLPFLHKNGIKKVISLIHELGNFYPKNSWKIVNDYSDKIIFPAQFVKDRALKNSFFDESKIVVKGQGLLKSGILDSDKKVARKTIRQELNLPEESFIILGCGTTIARKGIDIFVLSAISLLNRYEGKRPLYFVWLGDAPKNDHQFYIQRDIEQSEWGNHILFIGSKKNTIPYFVGSDSFYLTSRGDPFPCVVHEAMAADLPVIGFSNAGGFAEILHPLGLIPYGDIPKAVDALYKTSIDKVYYRTLSEYSRSKIKDFVFEDYAKTISNL